ncbi:MAG: NERD domain-containing protein [Enterococcus sp.]|nr:NERD domain-containing protein [Enterococcus sp.]
MSNTILSPEVENGVRRLHVNPDKLVGITHSSVEEIQARARDAARNSANTTRKSRVKHRIAFVSAAVLFAFSAISAIAMFTWLKNSRVEPNYVAPWGEGSWGVGNTIFVILTSLLFTFLVLKKTKRKRWLVLFFFLYGGIYYTAPTDTAVLIFSTNIPLKIFMSLAFPAFVLAIKLFSSNAKQAKLLMLRLTPKTMNNRWQRSADQKVFGKVGQVGDSGNIFGEGRASAGAEGERRTAYLLENLLGHVPGVQIYHGLRFPGSMDADVDHAVVLGDNVFLIDSKMFRPGTYFWGRGKEPTIYGGKAGPYRNHMDAAVRGFRGILPKGIRVEALIMIHNHNGLASISGVLHEYFIPDPPMRLVNAEDGMKHLLHRAVEYAGVPVSEEVKAELMNSLK